MHPLLETFRREALYDPEGWFLHDLVEVDPEAHRVVARMDTTALGALVDAQREIAGHVLHVPAATVIHSTGTLGQMYAVLVQGWTPSTGWAGYGTHIDKARWGRMGEIGPPVDAELVCTRRRQLRGTWFCHFDFRYTQGDVTIYRSSQRAVWTRRTPNEG